MKYDFLIVGAGLYGAVFAREALSRGKKVLVIDRRPHLAGNIHTEKTDGILVHRYGAHIFHTNNRVVWDYVNRFAVPKPPRRSPNSGRRSPVNLKTWNSRPFLWSGAISMKS